MNTNLMIRSGRLQKFNFDTLSTYRFNLTNAGSFRLIYFTNNLWQKQNNFKTLPAVVNHGIKIPPRIERGPTDILKALSATVNPEAQFLEYKYQYGRTFNIFTIYRKRLISLSMESGRKAAKWVVSENPELFQHKAADPYIQAYSPPKTFNEESEVSEEILLEMIHGIKVTSAIKVYELLQEKGLDVSNSTKQELLELVCFYNNTDKEDETLLEMKYFEHPSKEKTNTWDSQGFAMKLFSGMEQNAESYSAVILGMFKYNNLLDAMVLYEEAQDKDIKFDVDVYNAVIENGLGDSYQWDERREFILDTLKKMKKEDIQPNLETLNSALKSVMDMRHWFKSKEFAWSLYSEFTRIGIKPSLATYYYLVQIFLDRKGVNNILNYVLDEVENKELTLQHPDDLKFFPKLMEKCSYNFKSPPMATRIHNLLNTGNNDIFLCSQFNEASYYRCYLRTMFESGNLDDAMKIYSNLVPTTFLPDIGTFIILLEFIKLRKGIQCVPRLWEDIKQMTLSDSAKVVQMIVSIIEEAGSESTKETDLMIAKETWENLEKGSMKTRWTSELASSFLKIFSRIEDKNMALKAFDFADYLQNSFISLDFDSRSMFMKLCIKTEDKERAMRCIEYSARINDQNINKLKSQFIKGFKTDVKDLDRLKKVTPTPEEEIVL